MARLIVDCPDLWFFDGVWIALTREVLQQRIHLATILQLAGVEIQDLRSGTE
jgi:hypothetical protein